MGLVDIPKMQTAYSKEKADMERTMKDPSHKVGTREEKMKSGHRGEAEPGWVVPTKARP